jgi:hypothetical protein
MVKCGYLGGLEMSLYLYRVYLYYYYALAMRNTADVTGGKPIAGFSGAPYVNYS